MDLEIKLQDRIWDREKHLRHIQDSDWLPMLDLEKNPLEGIEGKHGVQGVKTDGTMIGADYIRMMPGSRFPIHEHDGDHEIFFIDGNGFVHIDGEDIAVREGHLIHIPGEYPHGVWVDPEASKPLIFVALGHPHKHVDAHDRMRTPHTHDK